MKKLITLVAVSLLLISGVVVAGLGSETGGSSTDSTDSADNTAYQYWGAADGNGNENVFVTGGKSYTSPVLKWHTEKKLVLKVQYINKNALPNPVAYEVSLKTEGSSDFTAITLDEDSEGTSYGLSISIEKQTMKILGKRQNAQMSFVLAASDTSLLSSVESLKVDIKTTFSGSNPISTSYTIDIYHPPKIVLNQPENGEGKIGYRVGSVENGDVSIGDTVELFVTVNDGYVFYQWVSSLENPIVDDIFTMPEEDVVLSAKFTKIDYTLSCTKAEVQYGGNLVLDIKVTFNNPSKVLEDPHFFIIAKYDESKVINVYSQVSLSESPGTSRIALSSLGLQDVFVEIVDGISSGLPEYHGYCHYPVSG